MENKITVSKRSFLQMILNGGATLILSPLVQLINFFSTTSEAQTQSPTGKDFGVGFLGLASPGYKEATKTYYPSPCSQPDRVYQPKNEKELGDLLRGLRSKNQRFAIRGGGHSFDNRSSNSKIVIDTTLLKGSGSGVKVNPQDGIATVRSGARLGGSSIDPKKTKLTGLYDELAKHDRILAAGTCPSVGVIGNILGGSLSAIPHFGYGAKGLKEVTFVSFKDGKTYRVNQNGISVADDKGQFTATTINGLSAPDLLKVFKGGGQGSLGVVTEIKLQSHNMKDFKAAEIKNPKGTLTEKMNWLSSLDPKTRSQVYMESHFNESGKTTQTMRALAPQAEWPALMQKINGQGNIKETRSAKELINSFLDEDGNNADQKLSRGANVMVPANSLNLAALRAAAAKGIDTAVYQAPSSEGTILTGSPNSYMIELEGSAKHGDLNQQALAALGKAPPKRFANYVTTGVETKPEEYYDKSNVDLIKRAMDEFNPKVAGHRASTSSLIDASDTPANACATDAGAGAGGRGQPAKAKGGKP
jgi:hypothetical protein